jgi:hypothetical protein
LSISTKDAGDFSLLTALVVSLLHRLAHVSNCLPDVVHDLGALVAHIALRNLEWTVHYLGSGLPIDDVSDFPVTAGANLVCLSVAPPRGMPEIRQAVKLLSRLYRPESPYRLAFGESGIEHTDEFSESQFESLGLFGSIGSFTTWVSETNKD